MRSYSCFLLLLLAGVGNAQSISDINFSYLYNFQAEPDMQINSVVKGDSVKVFFSIKSTTPSTKSFVIQWEKKDSYSQRQGAILYPHDTIQLINSAGSGMFRFAKPEKPWLLVAKVINITQAKSWIFFKQIEAHYPVNGYLERNGEKLFQPYKSSAGRYTVRGSGSGKPIYFSFYQDNFPSPTPPFAVKEYKADRFLFPDSIFSVTPGSEIGPFKKDGLYLAQEDTTSSEGFSFMIKKDPYPRYNTLQNLKGPLLFVTTRDENDKLGDAGEDKTSFDKIILDITKDKERAKTFMRNYFKRVEFANQLFTSYKEGWKTDRGMVYIVFGAPDEVKITGQQEIWAYKVPRQQFVFTKSGSVYAPDHYVLIRDKQYTEDWYQTIDLWRKSRF